MKKLVIFSLVISSLFSAFTFEVDGYGIRSNKNNILDEDTVKVKGYEGFGFLEYSKANEKAFNSTKAYLKNHKKIEGTDLYKVNEYANGDYNGRGVTENYMISEREKVGEKLWNGDKIKCSIRKDSSELPVSGSTMIKIKGLKKLPKQIDLKKCDKEVGKAFNQMLYGIDGAGYLEDDFDDRRKDSIRPYTSDIDFSNLDIIKINGHDYIPSKDNGKFKNGDIVTIRINQWTKNALDGEKVKILSDIVDVKVNSLINPIKICYKDPKKKIESPIGINDKNYYLEFDKNLQKYKKAVITPDNRDELSNFISDEEKGYKIGMYGLYASNAKPLIYDGYSITYPLYVILERKKDGKVDYKISNLLDVSITPKGKQIYWGQEEGVLDTITYSDANRNWNDPTTAVTNVSKFDDPYFKEFDLICLWNKDNNFETLKIKTK